MDSRIGSRHRFRGPSRLPRILFRRLPQRRQIHARGSRRLLSPPSSKRHAHRIDIVTSDYHTRRAGNIYRAQAPGLEIHMVAAPDLYFSSRRLVEKSRRTQNFFAGMDEDHGKLVRV